MTPGFLVMFGAALGLWLGLMIGLAIGLLSVRTVTNRQPAGTRPHHSKEHRAWSSR